ncbi:MAG: FlgD immunoglobulin-like domain containing protein [bacterium]
MLFKQRAMTSICSLLLLLCLPVTSAGDLCHDYEHQMRWLDFVEAGMYASDVAVRGQLACLVGFESPLSVVDISDPTAATVVGEFTVTEDPQAVALTPTHAVVACAHRPPAADGRLQVIDLGVTDSPILAGEVTLPGGAFDVTVAGDYAFVAADGLQIVDLGDPSNPIIIASLPVPHGRLLSLAGDVLLVLGQQTYPASLHVINVSNPALPEEVGYLELEYPARDLVAVDDYAYLSVNTGVNGGLLVVSVADPKRPYPSAFFPVSELAGHGLAVVDDVAYLDARNLYAIDVVKPTAPKLLGSIQLGGFAERIQVIGDTAYLAMGSQAGLNVIDIAEPRTTEPLASFPTDHSPGDLALAGDNAFLVNHGTSFLSLDITDPLAPEEVCKISLVDEASANRMVVDGNHAYITLERPGSFEVVDISDPDVPVAVGSVALSEDNGGLAIAGDHAYVGTFSDLYIIDISSRQNPTIVANPALPAGASLATYDHYLLTLPHENGSQQNWLRLHDITDPTDPVFTGEVAMPTVGQCMQVTVAGDKAYVCHYVHPLMRLLVVDLANPASPVILGETSYFSYLVDLVVAGDLAYGANLEGGLVVADISDPAAPRFLGSMVTSDLDFCRAVALHPDHVLLASGGLLVAPLHCDTSTPALLSRFDLQPTATAVDITWEIVGATTAADFRLLSRQGTVIRELAVKATGSSRYHARDQFDHAIPGGSVSYSLSLRTDGDRWSLLYEKSVELPTFPEREPLLHGAAPNPFNPSTSITFSLDQPRQVQLTVHDLTGRLVAILAQERFATGRHEVVWNGLDRAGRAVASGEYFCRLSTENTSQVRKMLLLR